MVKKLTASLVIIGNEILSGRTQDTNTAWLAEKLVERGISMSEVRIIPDQPEAIVAAVNELRQHSDYVLTTGGIGPTHDDITAESIAQAFHVDLEQNKEAYAILERHYGIEELTPPRLKMAMIPKGATLINNPVSGAPGFQIENVFVMAGVPRIMQAMFDDVIEKMDVGDRLLSNTVACGLQESAIAIDLGELQGRYPTIEIGSYPHYRGGVLGLSIVLRSVEADMLEKATEELIKLIRHLGDEPRALSLQTAQA